MFVLYYSFTTGGKIERSGFGAAWDDISGKKE